MTYACCPTCRLRFSPATAGYLAACPQCGEPPQPTTGLEDVVGYRLFTLEDVPPSFLDALEASMPFQDPNADNRD
jgi:hypothetical protein